MGQDIGALWKGFGKRLWKCDFPMIWSFVLNVGYSFLIDFQQCPRDCFVWRVLNSDNSKSIGHLARRTRPLLLLMRSRHSEITRATSPNHKRFIHAETALGAKVGFQALFECYLKSQPHSRNLSSEAFHGFITSLYHLLGLFAGRYKSAIY